MDDNNVILHGTSVEQECDKCKEHEGTIEQIAIFLLAALFIGPIIGMLVGLFAGKKLSR